MAEETKATKSKESSQPKSVASSVSVEGRPSSHGLDRRRSWSPKRKQRHGDERQDSPRHQSSRRDGSRRESERSRPSSSGGSSSRRRAESGSVSKASDTRPSASSSQHHHHSSGDHRSLSSSSSPASPDRRSPASHERRRESADRTGPTYVTRWDVKLSPKPSKPPEKRTIKVVSSPALQVHVESSPEVQSRHRWRTARQVPTQQQATARTQVETWQHATARLQATGATALPQVTAQLQGTGWSQWTTQPVTTQQMSQKLSQSFTLMNRMR